MKGYFLKSVKLGFIASCCLLPNSEMVGAETSPQNQTKEFIPIPKATKIPSQFYSFTVPESPKEETVPEPEPVPEPVVEPERPPVAYKDSRPSLKAAEAKRRLSLRRAQQRQFPEQKTEIVFPEEPLYTKDPHYRQWDQRIEEDKFTYPVDRDWVLTEDRYISGILETEINSSLGGRVVLVVDRPVFTAKGWTVILPQYTKVVCEYQPLTKVSDTRLSLRCVRAIRPDGGSVLLTEANGTDAMGRSGLVGDIDYRTTEKYGSAFMMSVISSLASAGSRVSGSPLIQEGSISLSQNLGEVTARMIEQNIDLAPVITIEAGTRVHIRPQTDIWLRRPVSKAEVEAYKKTQEEQEKPEEGHS